jgi:hypothetical protein
VVEAEVEARVRGWPVLNLLAWLGVAAARDAAVEPYGRAQLASSGVFAAICAFRSFVPRVDLERFCLRPSALSSIFVGRSAATVAEMCFAGQCALLLGRLGDATGDPALTAVAWIIVPLIAVAQVACWYAVIRLDHRGHAVEEVLWAVMVGLVEWGLVRAWGHQAAPGLPVALLGLVACLGAAIVMLAVDVPMYVARWRQGVRRGERPLPLARGLADAVSRRRVTDAWEVWRAEAVWMSLYFSAGVWLSLGLVFV